MSQPNEKNGMGQVFIKPEGARAWTPLGLGTMVRAAIEFEQEMVRLRTIAASSASMTFELNRFGRRWAKRQRHYALAPKPLAAGCLPASKLATRRWR